MNFKIGDIVNGIGLFSYIQKGVILEKRLQNPFFVVKVEGFEKPHRLREIEMVLANV